MKSLCKIQFVFTHNLIIYNLENKGTYEEYCNFYE